MHLVVRIGTRHQDIKRETGRPQVTCDGGVQTSIPEFRWEEIFTTRKVCTKTAHHVIFEVKEEWQSSQFHLSTYDCPNPIWYSKSVLKYLFDVR